MSTVEQIVKDAVSKLAIEQMGAAAEKVGAFQTLFEEIASALTDIVGAMEAEGKDEGASLAKALTEGLRSLRIESPTVNVAAPSVSVNVSPTPIQNNVTVPEPTVTVIQQPAGAATFTVKLNYEGRGNFPSSMTITRQ